MNAALVNIRENNYEFNQTNFEQLRVLYILQVLHITLTSICAIKILL